MATRAVGDTEDVAHSLLTLKMETNTITQDNLKLRTRNKNLENVVETQNDDLHSYQQEI